MESSNCVQIPAETSVFKLALGNPSIYLFFDLFKMVGLSLWTYLATILEKKTSESKTRVDLTMWHLKVIFGFFLVASVSQADIRTYWFHKFRADVILVNQNLIQLNFSVTNKQKKEAFSLCRQVDQKNILSLFS